MLCGLGLTKCLKISSKNRCRKNLDKLHEKSANDFLQTNWAHFSSKYFVWNFKGQCFWEKVLYRKKNIWLRKIVENFLESFWSLTFIWDLKTYLVCSQRSLQNNCFFWHSKYSLTCNSEIYSPEMKICWNPESCFIC